MTAVSRLTWSRRVAHGLLDRYPRRWRARYGVEMHAMLDAMPVTWRQVADLGIGAVREWLSPRAVGWPARSAAGRVLQRRYLRFMLVPIAFEGIAYAAFAWTGRPTEVSWLEPVVVVLLFAGLARYGIGYWHATTTRWGWLSRQRWLGSCSGAEVAFWFVALAVWVAYLHVRSVPPYVRDPSLRQLTWHVQAFFWAGFLFRGSARTQRLRRVEFAHLRRLNTEAEQELFKLPSRLGMP